MAENQDRQQRPECWWCGQAGASNEDVVPLWLGTLYPGPAWWVHETAHPDIGEYKTKRAKRPATKSRKFCRECNNGWMSQLEQRAKPLLEPMIKDEPVRIDEEDQELIAFWICKTALAFISMEPEEYRFASRELYHELYRAQAPLSQCQVWLGSRNAGKSVAWHRAHSLERNREPGGGFGSTLAIGSLIAHLVWHDAPGERLAVGTDLAAAFVQIWPIKRPSRLWPPPRTLGGTEFSWLAKAFASGSDLVPV